MNQDQRTEFSDETLDRIGETGKLHGALPAMPEPNDASARVPEAASQTVAARPPSNRPRSARRDVVALDFKGAAQALQSAGLDYLLIRGWETPNPDEIDLVIRPGSFEQVAATLRPAGFATVLFPGRGSHRFLVRYDIQSDRWLKLDTVTEMAFGPRQELPGADADDLLRRAESLDGVRVLGRGDRLWATLLHRFGDPQSTSRSSELADVDLPALGAEADPWSPLAEPFVTCRTARARRATGPAGVIDLARQEDSAALARVSRMALARIRSRRAPQVAMRIAYHDVRHVLRRARSAITVPARPGLVVALLGPDGAGKSGLAASFATSSPLPVRMRYMGLYQVGAPAQRARRRGIAGLYRLATVVSVSIRSWLDRRRGRVVVLDRHVYDLLARGGSRRAKVRRALYVRVGIRPDITIVLDAPPEILHERRPEQSVGHSAEERARYARIAVAVPGAVVVDASQALADVAASVNAIVWDRLLILSNRTS